MRFVIYDDETLEPITVVNIRGFTERDIERHGRHYRIPVHPTVSEIMARPPAKGPPKVAEIRVVELRFEPFRRWHVRRPDQESWMCFTRAADLAMLLKPDWLPGQRSTVEYLENQNDKLVELLMAEVGNQ